MKVYVDQSQICIKKDAKDSGMNWDELLEHIKLEIYYLLNDIECLDMIAKLLLAVRIKFGRHEKTMSDTGSFPGESQYMCIALLKSLNSIYTKT